MPPIDRESHIQIRNILKSIGFDDKEADVYLTLLAWKSSIVKDLSKATELPRTTLYFILDRLQEKGFVSMVEHGKVQMYVAEEPQKLVEHMRERQTQYKRLEQQLESVMPALMSLGTATAFSPKVKMLYGMDGLKQTYQEILPHEFLGLLNPAVMYKSFGMTTPELLFDNKINMRGRDLIVQGEFTEKFTKDLAQTDMYTYRLLPPTTKFFSDVLIWENKTALFSYDAQHTVIQIESTELTGMFRSWFETMWDISTPAPFTAK